MNIIESVRREIALARLYRLAVLKGAQKTFLLQTSTYQRKKV